jgi:tRNA 2-thiouridine synthesizing protein A
MAARELDLSGLKCPLPVLRSRKVLKSMGPGDELCVISTDPLSVIDIPHMVAQEGHRVTDTKKDGERFRFTILVGSVTA